MEHKILVADDSLTIQKVIKITLANEPFELRECADAAKLQSKVKELGPAMVLLDFNLSESKTGYDLCREIKEVDPNIGVLMLFGTFDTIDEQLLADCGCNYHIVKPFDGTKFINLCRALASDYESIGGEADSFEADSGETDSGETDSGETGLPEKIGEEEAEGKAEGKVEEADGEDQWVVNQPLPKEPVETFAPENSLKQESSNKLELDVEEWGMEVPSVIGSAPGKEGEAGMEVPGVISDGQSGDGQEAGGPGEKPSSKLVPLDELKQDTSTELHNELQGEQQNEQHAQDLEEKIQDEIEEADLWSADIVEDVADKEIPSQIEDEFKAWQPDNIASAKGVQEEEVQEEEVQEEEEDLEPIRPHNLREVSGEQEDESDQAPADFPKDVMQDAVEASSPSISEEELNGRLEDKLEEMKDELKRRIEQELSSQLSPLVEKFVKEYCKEKIEKTAWEVIPDLAENIIKKEIQKISDSLMD